MTIASTQRFVGFSEAAKLYADNAAIVDEMYRQFHADVHRLVDVIRDAVRAQVGAAFHEKFVGRSSRSALHSYRYWWLENDETYLWIDTRDVKIVSKSVLAFGASCERLSSAKILDLRATAEEPDFREFCRVGAKSEWGFLKALISASGEKVIEEGAERLTRLMLALHAAEHAPEKGA